MEEHQFGFSPEIENELNGLFQDFHNHQHLPENEDLVEIENSLLHGLQNAIPGILRTPFFTFNMNTSHSSLEDEFRARFENF